MDRELKKALRRLSIAAALFLVSGLDVQSKAIYQCNGGNMVDVWTRLRSYGHVEIMGDAISACTMAAKFACAGPRGRLGVHSPSGVRGKNLGHARNIMLNTYPGKLRAAVMRDGAHLRSGITWYKASAYLPRCK